MNDVTQLVMGVTHIFLYYRKDTEPLYHSFMYSAASMLSQVSRSVPPQNHATAPCSSKSTMQPPCTAQLAGHPPCKSWPAKLRGT